MTVGEFFQKFGGARPVARKLGLPHTTVAAWVQRNSIPPWRIARLAELAHEAGASMPADFGPRNDRRAA